jgi:hypothetical protein
MMESNTENHAPNQPKPVVTQGDAHLNINLCHMKRLSELMNETVLTLNDIFNDSSQSDATKIRKARSTGNLLNQCFGQIDVSIQDCMKKSSCLEFSRRYLSQMKAKENAQVKRKQLSEQSSSNKKSKHNHPAERLKSLSKSLECAFNEAIVAVTPPADKATIGSVRTIDKYLAASDVLKQADPPDDGQAYTMRECINMLKDNGQLSGTKIGKVYKACTQQRKPHPPLILASERTLRRRWHLYITKGVVPLAGDFGITMGAPNKISPDKRNQEINSHIIMSSTLHIEILKDTARKIQMLKSLKARSL